MTKIYAIVKGNEIIRIMFICEHALRYADSTGSRCYTTYLDKDISLHEELSIRDIKLIHADVEKLTDEVLSIVGLVARFFN